MADRRRMFVLLLAMTVCLAGIAGRLFWIQVVAVHSLTNHEVDLVRNSVLQRQRGLVLDSGRGQFTDRDGRPLTGRTLKGVLAFPIAKEVQDQLWRTRSAAQRRALLELLHTDEAGWRAFAASLKEPAWWRDSTGRVMALTDNQAQKLEELALPNVRVAEMTERYPNGMPARQLIGFIGQNPERISDVFQDQLKKGQLRLNSEIGASGLEKTFEPWLRALGPTTVSYFTDANKHPLQGLDMRVVTTDSAHYPLTVQTTLDGSLQSAIEKQLDLLGIRKGAVVVLDTRNADVLAMASRPSFRQDEVDLKQGGWVNRALQQTTPGSIFKTVVAAAALEANIVSDNETFDCEGEYGKYGFRCWYKPGHGRITLEQAFAESCNITFAKVMMRLNAKQLETTARELGLLTQVGWHGTIEGREFKQFDGEQAGQLFAPGTPKNDEGVLIQTAIGQRDVRVSPLQAANLVVTLLNGGKVMEPRVVSGITLKDGKQLEAFPEHTLVPARSGISAATSRKLLGWMREVVETGTGTALRQAIWPLAGKSGTAQLETEANPTDNQWFIGYAPAGKPQYAIAVLAESVPSGSANQAIAAFKAVADILAKAAVSP